MNNRTRRSPKPSRPSTSSSIRSGNCSHSRQSSRLRDRVPSVDFRFTGKESMEKVPAALKTPMPVASLESLPTSCTCQHLKLLMFNHLPVDCKRKIFSYLSPMDKGRASQVCQEWAVLLRSPSMWPVVDFTVFPLCLVRDPTHLCTQLCYDLYCSRIQKFVWFLHAIKPAIKYFRFEYDIADNWLNFVEDLLSHANCHDLRFARMNWKDTAVRPFWRYDMFGAMRGSDNYAEHTQHHRQRQRMFVQFFDMFSQIVPNLRQLALPFDWSDRTVSYMKRFRNLETLAIEKYFIFQGLRQEALSNLLKNCPTLERLLLEVWLPSGRGLLLYTMESESIRFLDISQCRGFYLQKVYLPKLKEIRVARRPWNGPLVTSDSLHVPCLYSILSQGAANLHQINDLILADDWRNGLYPQLDQHFGSVCSCSYHKSGWLM